jgi:outer membrane biosynthesis protein TonB
MTAKKKPAPQPKDGRARAQVKDRPCPQCGEKFTEKGLPGHLVFRHNVKPKEPAHGQPEAQAPLAPQADAAAAAPRLAATLPGGAVPSVAIAGDDAEYLDY